MEHVRVLQEGGWCRRRMRQYCVLCILIRNAAIVLLFLATYPL